MKLSVRFLQVTDFIDHIWHHTLCTKSCTAAGMRFVGLSCDITLLHLQCGSEGYPQKLEQ